MTGINDSSFVDDALGNLEKSGLMGDKSEILIKNAAAQIYAGVLNLGFCTYK